MEHLDSETILLLSLTVASRHFYLILPVREQTAIHC